MTSSLMSIDMLQTVELSLAGTGTSEVPVWWSPPDPDGHQVPVAPHFHSVFHLLVLEWVWKWIRSST